MPEAPKMCFDRILPADMNRPHRMLSVGGRTRAIIVVRKMWINGTILHVRFMGGTDEQHQIVKDQAKWWTQHANLTFVFDDAPDADIRIKFDSGDGAWSYVGTDCASIPQHEATMNLGFLDRGTPAHEFGHAIGLGHEHSNPEGGIQWNRNEVIRDLSRPPNSWTVAQIEHNVFHKYDADQINGTHFDTDSIMLYEFPARWTTNGVGTHGNSVLSATDITFIGGAEAYPKDIDPDPVELEVIDTKPTTANIGQPGEEDLFVFTVANDGRHIIETTGGTDVVMKLFGPDNQTSVLAEDDDGGQGMNSRIVADLSPGRYWVQIRHYNQAGGTGTYGISVSR